MSKITPCLWFDGQAEEAAAFYTSTFPNSRIDRVNRSPGETPSGPEGSVLTVDFTLDGEPFIALNGGPEFTFNEAISFSIDCEDQAEVDRYWEALDRRRRRAECLRLVEGPLRRLVAGRAEGPPRDDERVRPRGAARALEAMLKMTKLDVEKLREADDGVPA